MNDKQRHEDRYTQEHSSGMREKPWSSILSAAILIAGLLLRLLHYLNNRSLWLDEAKLARNILDRGPIELLTPLEYNQGAPILFLLLVDATTALLGSSELALRLVPLLETATKSPFP